MNNRRKLNVFYHMIVFVIVATSVFNVTFVLHAQTSFKIGISDDPPYEYLLENGTVAGMATEIITEILKEMNITEYKIELLPWKRALEDLTTGDIRALYSIGHTEERAQVYYYPDEPLFETTWIFFIRQEDKDTLRFTSLDDLKGKQIGVVRGYKYTPAFWEFVKREQNYEEVTIDEQNYKKLEIGRVDYVLGDYLTGVFLAKKLGITQRIFALTDNPLETVPLYIAFSKKGVQQEFVENFSNTLKAFKTGEQYQAILEKYTIAP